MSEIVKRLRDRRSNVWEQAKELADRAADENRAFTAEEQGTWDALNDELNKLDARIKSALDTEKRAQDAEEVFNQLERKPQERGTKTPEQSQMSNELRAFLRGEPGSPRAFEVKPTAEEMRAPLFKGTSAQGGATVPTSFYGRLIAHLIETSGVLQTGPTVLNTEGGEIIQVPKTTAHSAAVIMTTQASGSAPGEGQTIPTSEPTFGQTPLGAWKYGALFQISRELLSDTGVDLEGYLAMQAGRALGNGFGQHAVIGSGTNQPRGVATDATAVQGPTGTSTTFGTQSTVGQGFDLLISLYHSVIAPYRASRSAAWLMNDTTASLVRRIKNTDGVYVWQDNVQVGQPPTILGKPVFIDPFVASPAANAKSVLFGDFSQFFVRFAGGARFERSDDFAFNSDMVTFRALLRADSALVDLTGAVKAFQHSAT